MATPSGYPSNEKDARLGTNYVTVEPISEKQDGLSVNVRVGARVIASDTAESGSTESVIVATAHSAIRGDIIRITSGTHQNKEVRVWEVDTNSITLAETLDSAIANGVTFEIRRQTYLKLDGDGGLAVSAGNIQFSRNGVDTVVTEDTGTPANARPLPVKLLDGSGNERGTTTSPVNVALPAATELKLDNLADIEAAINGLSKNTGAVDATTLRVKLSNEDVAYLDGLEAAVDGLETNTTGLNTLAKNTGAVDANTLRVKLSNEDAAYLDGVETTLSAIDTKLGNIDAGTPAALGQATMANSQPVVLASDQSTLPINEITPAAKTVKQAAITVGTSAVRLTTDASAPDSDRVLLIAVPDPASTATFYIGSSSVANSGANRGIPIVAGEKFIANFDAGDYYIIASAASQTVFITEQE